MTGILKPFGNLLNPGSLQKPTGQVAIDWGNPITRSLEFAVVFDGAFGNDLVKGYGATPTNGPTQAMSIDGTAANYPNGGTAYHNFSGSTNDTPYLGPISIVWRGLVRTSGFRQFAQKTASNGADHCPFEFRTNNDATAIRSFLARSNNSAVNTWLSANPGMGILNKLTSWGVTQAGTGDQNTLPVFYFDGINDGPAVLSSGTASAPYTGSSQPIWIGRRQDGAVQMDGFCLHCYIWSRVLTADEMAWLALSPYDFLIPAEYELPILNTAAAAAFNAYWAQGSNLPVLGTGTY